MTLSHRFPLALALAALAGAPLAAQTVTDPPKTGATVAKEAAVDAQEQPATQTLNKAVAAVGNDAEKVNAENQAQYDADVAAYRAAVEAHAMATMHDDARYARQQRAYADAMAQWRVQVAACKQGKQKACDLPTPDPAAYY